MFKATRMLFVYVETPLHVGSGRGLGAVDLPIQRERTTNYPIVQASSLKGRMRAAVREKKGWSDDSPELTALFGKASDPQNSYAGAISFGDARILLFPVRSLAGVFAWTTSVDALARFKRAAQIAKLDFPWDLPEPPDDKVWVNSGGDLIAGQSVVLEEFSFTPDSTYATTLQPIAEWLGRLALPQTGYKYWQDALPKKLCILPEDAFRDFTRYATEVQTHIKLKAETKTVDTETGALWTTESLPTDTLLYAPVMAMDARIKLNGATLKADAVLQQIVDLELDRTQLGGDETTGQGMVALRFQEAPNEPTAIA